MDWFLKVVQDHYADFDGRARRKEYWMFQLFGFLIAVGIMIVTAILGAVSESFAVLGIIGYVVFGLGLMIPSLAVGIRRLHDTGRSGWWLLLGLIPFGGLVVLYFLVLEGDAGPNLYGEDPKDPYNEMSEIEDFERVLDH